MNNLIKLGLVAAVTISAGCANRDIKPTTVLCPVLGATLGAGIVGAGLGTSQGGAYAGGAVLGVAMGHFFCKERVEPAKTRPVSVSRSAPRKPKPLPPKDIDNDGVIDRNDDCPGTPAGLTVNNAGCPEIGEKLISLDGINFDTDSSAIKTVSEVILEQAVVALKANPSVHVLIEGHTDSRGTVSHNRKLSEDRANVVMSYLIAQGIQPERLSAVGKGEATPVAPNNTPENMYKNRRVDLVVTDN